MSKQKTTRAKTSRSLPVFIADTSSTTGGGLSGVTHTSSGLVMEYRRQNQSTWTSVTAVSKTLGTYVSGGIVASGSLAGRYEVDFPDAAFASAAGVEWVELCVRGVANMLPVLIEIELDAVDYQDAAAFGLSRIDATIGSRSTYAGGPVDSVTGAVGSVASYGTLVSDITTSVWSAGTRTLTGFGTLVSDVATAVWSAATRTLTAFGFNVNLTPSTGLGTQNGSVALVTKVDELGANAFTANSAGDEVADAVWDAPYNQHTTAGSFGKLMDILRKANTVVEGTVTSAVTPTATTFSSSINYPTGAFKHAVLVFVNSAAIDEQNSPILGYVNTNGVFTVEEAFTVAPTVGDEFIVIPTTHVHSVAAIADGVWDEATSGHTTAGTTGKALIDSGAAGNPWSTDLATGYSGTQAGNILNSVKSQADLITSGGTVYVTSPVTASGQLTSPLIIGDDYLAANGRRFRWTVELPSGYVIATSTARFGMRYEDDEGVNSFIKTGTVSDAGSGNVYLDFDLTKEVETGLLRPGWYEWSVEIVSGSGVEVTRVKSGKNVEWQEKQT
jgi:hypothetical protein